MAAPDLVTVYSDGGARGNPGPAAIGVVLCDRDERVLEEYKEYIGPATNNEAEYRALIKGLELAARRTRGEVACATDSELVARQLTGVYRVREPRLEELYRQVRERERPFRRVTYRHFPRLTGRLARADALVNEALDEAGH